MPAIRKRPASWVQAGGLQGRVSPPCTRRTSCSPQRTRSSSNGVTPAWCGGARGHRAAKGVPRVRTCPSVAARPEGSHARQCSPHPGTPPARVLHTPAPALDRPAPAGHVPGRDRQSHGAHPFPHRTEPLSHGSTPRSHGAMPRSRAPTRRISRNGRHSRAPEGSISRNGRHSPGALPRSHRFRARSHAPLARSLTPPPSQPMRPSSEPGGAGGDSPPARATHEYEKRPRAARGRRPLCIVRIAHARGCVP